MKPMIALIATGIILLLVMLYFGKSSFDGTYENNVYENSAKYNDTANDIKEIDGYISNVKLISDAEKNQVSASFKIDTENLNKKYKDFKIDNVFLMSPSKNIESELEKVSENQYILKNNIKNGLYLLVFHISTNNKNFKVQKTAFLE